MWWSGKYLKPDGVGMENSLYAYTTRSPLTRRVLVGVIIALLGFFVGSTALANPGRETVFYEDGRVLSPPTLTALSSSCTGVVTTPEPPETTFGWVAPPKTSPAQPGESDSPFWYSIPPVSGNFYPQTFSNVDSLIPFSGEVSKGEVPTLGQAVALLYRGWVVVWYRSGVVEESKVVELFEQVQQTPELRDRVIFAPWPYEGEEDWGGGKPWVLTSWGSWQKCSNPSLRLVYQFAIDHPTTSAPGYRISLNETGPEASNRNRDFPQYQVESQSNFD